MVIVFMEPFNIKIGAGNKEVTLTILPDHNYYKVIYYVGVLGAVHYNKEANKWEAVAPDEVDIGDLPPYSKDLDNDHVEIELDQETVHKIGMSIENLKISNAC